MDLGLRDKVALVTGAASARGIGRAIALQLAEEGADVACVDINLEGAQSVAGEIRAVGRRSVALKVDQGDYEQVKAAVAEIGRELGAIDVLVNNAALLGNTAFLSKMEPAAWDREINVNLSGPYYWVREVFDSMAGRGWGRIISISSMAGVMGSFGLSGYASSKGGLVSLTKTVALEGARAGITANAVSLGVIATDSYYQIRVDLRERIQKRVALEAPGDVQDVASIVAFLASERARYITGANIVVDGGLGLFVY